MEKIISYKRKLLLFKYYIEEHFSSFILIIIIVFNDPICSAYIVLPSISSASLLWKRRNVFILRETEDE